MLRLTLALLCCAVTLAPFSFAEDPPAEDGKPAKKSATTPKACYEMAREAMIARDGAAFFELLGEAPRKQLAEQVAQIQAAAKANPEALPMIEMQLGVKAADIPKLTPKTFLIAALKKVPQAVIDEAKTSKYVETKMDGETKAVVINENPKDDGTTEKDEMPMELDPKTKTWKITKMN